MSGLAGGRAWALPPAVLGITVVLDAEGADRAFGDHQGDGDGDENQCDEASVEHGAPPFI